MGGRAARRFCPPPRSAAAIAEGAERCNAAWMRRCSGGSNIAPAAAADGAFLWVQRLLDKRARRQRNRIRSDSRRRLTPRTTPGDVDGPMIAAVEVASIHTGGRGRSRFRSGGSRFEPHRRTWTVTVDGASASGMSERRSRTRRSSGGHGRRAIWANPRAVQGAYAGRRTTLLSDRQATNVWRRRTGRTQLGRMNRPPGPRRGSLATAWMSADGSRAILHNV